MAILEKKSGKKSGADNPASKVIASQTGRPGPVSDIKRGGLRQAIRKTEAVEASRDRDAAATNEEDSHFAVEMLQARILNGLFLRATRDMFLVKGGMAMQMITGSRRFTKDIDLAADPQIPVTTLSSHMERAIESALACGILEDCTFRAQDTRNGGVSPKWHINGVMRDTGSKVHLTIEVSRRDQLPEDGISRFEFKPDSKFGVCGYTARTYSPLAVAASKVSALVSDLRVSARDIYDLFVLIEMNVEPPVNMLAAMGAGKVEEFLGKLWRKLDIIDFEKFRTDVIPHLPKTARERFDSEEMYDVMRLTVGENLQKWLEEARKYATEEIPRTALKDRYKEVSERRRAAIGR